jgi:hypothetical protein
MYVHVHVHSIAVDEVISASEKAKYVTVCMCDEVSNWGQTFHRDSALLQLILCGQKGFKNMSPAVKTPLYGVSNNFRLCSIL